jgi:hypothetical protein
VLKVLNDLDDVEAAQYDGALLQYNAGNLRWESTTTINAGVYASIRTVAVAPDTVASDQVKNLNDLNDVDAANVDGAFLQYDAGALTWKEQLDFDGGVYAVGNNPFDFVEPSYVGTTAIENLNDFQDVNAQPVDTAYLIYNDTLNYWEETTTIDGGSF